jgi:hypothetical protein
MNRPNITYIAAIALCILGFNFALLTQVKTGKGLPIAIVCLVILFALVVFRNRNLHLTQSGRVAAFSLVGVALTATSDIAALVYALIGLLALMLVQLRVIARGDQKWLLVGGNPLHKLDTVELAWTKIGLSMLASVALAFFIKVAWVVYAV